MARAETASPGHLRARIVDLDVELLGQLIVDGFDHLVHPTMQLLNASVEALRHLT